MALKSVKGILSGRLEAAQYIFASRLWDLGSAASIQLKGLILAQNERWRRGLGMQVEREAFKRYLG